MGDLVSAPHASPSEANPAGPGEGAGPTGGRTRVFLRYWRAVLKHEAMSHLGCPAEPLDEPDAPFQPDLLQPSASGRSYFEISTATDQAGELGDLLLQRIDNLLLRPLQCAHQPLFERWLRARYLQRRMPGRAVPEDGSATIAVGFPVLRYRDRGRPHLAPLLQLPVIPTWCDAAGDLWEIPSGESRDMDWRDAPGSLRLQAFDTASLGQPFLLNDGLLQRVLGHDPEHVADLLAWIGESPELTAEQMLHGVCAYLTGGELEVHSLADAEPSHLLSGLANALEQALPRGRQAGLEQAAIVVETNWGVPTAQLQRELGEILRRSEPVLPRPLALYLGGDDEPQVRATRYGCVNQRHLTDDQRKAAERSLGSPLVVVEGPPGTGKTEVILSLGADALVRCVASGVYDERGAKPLPLMVASTNNQAVDAVIQPLMEVSEFPFCIRMGNRHVLATRTDAALARVQGWLEGAERTRSGVDLADALERFRAIAAGLQGRLEGRTSADQAQEEWSHAHRRLPEILRALEGLPEPLPDERPPEEQMAGLREVLGHVGEIYDALDALYGRVEAFTPFHPETADAMWTRVVEPHLEAARPRWADHCDLPLSFRPPGSAGGRVRAMWMDGLYSQVGLAAAMLDALQGRHERLLALCELHVRRRSLEEQRDALGDRLGSGEPSVSASETSDADVISLAQAQHALFREALNVREAWARSRSTRLLPLLRRLRTAAQGRSWWQGHLEGEEDRDLFTALFPVAGCTLLSIGTSWPLVRDLFDQLVIDEAGQCLPSYPVTALYRARRVVFFGDTHQLEPVTSLSAHEEVALLEGIHPQGTPGWLDRARSHRDAPTSAQALAQASSAEVIHLREHFRCQEEIIAISNRLCGYDLTVRTPARSLSKTCRSLSAPVRFVPTDTEQERWCGSQRNPEEARLAADLVAGMIGDGVEPASIGVISPYRAQTALLDSYLRQRKVPLDNWETDYTPGGDLRRKRISGVLLGTIHRLQGGERDVIILSTVATRSRSLGWLNRRPNLLNVAVSRARLHLVVLGSADALAQGEYTRHLLPTET